MIKRSELTKEVYKTGEVGKMLGVCTNTVQGYCNSGKLKCDISPTGRRIIPKESVIDYLNKCGLLYDDSNDDRRDVVYARVSTSKQKYSGDLDRQRDAILVEVSTRNPKDLLIVTEVASGLNDKRRELTKILNLVCDNKIDRIFVLHKDRLTRFGFNYINFMCQKHGTEIVVLSNETDNKTTQEELAEDIVSIIHSFSGKLYGMRRKITQAVDEEFKNDPH